MERTPANAEYSFGISYADQIGPMAAYGIYHGKVRMIIVGYPGELEELIVRIWHGPPDPWNPDGWAVLGGSVDGIEVRRRQIAIELCSRYDAHRASAIEWVKVEDL